MLAALGAAGCGGGSGDAPSRATWAGRANAACREGTAALAPVSAAIARTARSGDAARIYRRTGALVAQAVALTTPRVDRLDALPRPVGDDARIAAWVASVRRQLTTTAALGRAFAARDETQVAQLSAAAAEQDAASDRAAADLGLVDCVRLAGSTGASPGS